jgi:PAS domain-containing protein
MLISPTVLAFILFVVFLLLVALVLVAMLLRDVHEKQKVYANFSGYLTDLLIVMSKEGRLLDAMPKYVSDPLYEQILRNRSFKPILSQYDYNRLQEYVKGLDAYPDIPFVFSFESESKLCWYELRAHMRKRGSDENMVLHLRNVTQEVEIGNQRDHLKDNVDMLLRSTGDFLWSLDVDTRRFSFITPLMDDEGRVVPRSLGIQDIRLLMPEEDYAFFEKHLNARIVEFRATGQDISENRGVRLRLTVEEGKQIWFAFCGRLCSEENAKIVFKGSARRLDMILDNPIVASDIVNESTMSSVFAFPDIRVFWIDRDYKICGCNQAFSLAFGMPLPDDVKGKRLLEVVRPRYFNMFHSVISEVFERGLPKAWKGPFGVKKRLLWFNAVPLKRTDGYTHRVLGVYMQLDEQDFENTQRSTLEIR